MGWLLIVNSLLIEILLVMKPVFVSGRMTFLAAHHYIRIFNSWEDASPYSGLTW